jgi:hypothetical protein
MVCIFLAPFDFKNKICKSRRMYFKYFDFTFLKGSNEARLWKVIRFGFKFGDAAS